MALDPLELGVIAAVLVVFFLWGPQKIPELAKAIGQARREFDNASREFQKVSNSIQDGTSPFFASSNQGTAPAALPQPQAAPKTGDQLLIEAARRLGIQTQGKTREQIQQDIIASAQRPNPSVGAQPGAEDPEKKA